MAASVVLAALRDAPYGLGKEPVSGRLGRAGKNGYASPSTWTTDRYQSTVPDNFTPGRS
jgi:hypothetical protein